MPWDARRAAPIVVTHLALLVVLGAGAGCRSTPQLMPTPNVYLHQPAGVFAAVPPAQQTNVVEILYVTDRAPERDKQGRLHYSFRRSASLAFGFSRVALGRDVPWPTLVTNSLSAKRRLKLPLTLRDVQELGRFPATPYPMTKVEGGFAWEPEIAAAHAQTRRALQAEIQRRLSQTSRREVYVFIHGFNNDFTWANLLSAQLWHFLQREGLFIAYTWPGGRGGLRGYSYDRESGEFTVGHLKQFLRTLLDCPGVTKVHLLAHSRGADVLTSALRELAIERRPAESASAHFERVANVVLMAPDLDAEVSRQRLGLENVELSVARFTVYSCLEDRAITFSNWMFEGVRRLGILLPADLSVEQREALTRHRNVQFINARVKTSFLGHGYFYSSPAVSSDLLLLLRQDCDAGTPDCRPLESLDGVFWRLQDGYPAPPVKP